MVYLINMSFSIQAGVNLNMQNEVGDTPLHISTHDQHEDAVRLLKVARANTKIRNKVRKRRITIFLE